MPYFYLPVLEQCPIFVQQTKIVKEMQTETIIKPKKSMPLSSKEIQALNDLVNRVGMIEATFVVRVSRETLTRVLLVGSGSEKTITAIRKNLPK